jgi:transcriptional regulator with XRE-family HTH domain
MEQEKQQRGILLTHLRAWRHSKGLTQRDLSALTGPDALVPYPHISRIESQLQAVTPRTIRKLAKALGITVEQLINTSPGDLG